ncbi:AGE family epimerase/isomerase [Salinispira pacifica]|uniref:N-acylglucosamine 2-epimerase n=1 Tax=Salinispira pacifica TaxID=1307761 RepID=V5WK45_9SPIO|nr:AGE family epimerase/isomerase [Salinispira pacifica]AHC15546.1 N-acylglucosamine 2-epimerase [Salinispira pacifica]
MNSILSNAPETELREEIRQICRSQVLTHILPFWLSAARSDGSIPPRVDPAGISHPDASRGLVMISRLLWTFSRLNTILNEAPDQKSPEGTALFSGLLESAEQIRNIMRWAKETLTSGFRDGEHEGFFWTITPEGRPDQSHKQMYGQAFALYGMSEYLKAEDDPEVLELCHRTFDLIHNRGQDAEYRGYWDACSRDWTPQEDVSLSDADIPCAKSMNTHLHILEAFSCYAQMLRMRGSFSGGSSTRDSRSGTVTHALEELVSLHLQKITHRDSGHLQLYFTRDWKAIGAPNSFGHDIEAFWLIREAMEILPSELDPNPISPGPEQLFTAAVQGLRSFEAQLPDAARRLELSCMINETHEGTEDSSRIWWVQAEAAAGLGEAWRMHKERSTLEQLWRIINFIEHVQTSALGEWHWRTDEYNQPDTSRDMAGMWKTPYHNVRAMLEVLHRI